MRSRVSTPVVTSTGVGHKDDPTLLKSVSVSYFKADPRRELRGGSCRLDQDLLSDPEVHLKAARSCGGFGQGGCCTADI